MGNYALYTVYDTDDGIQYLGPFTVSHQRAGESAAQRLRGDAVSAPPGADRYQGQCQAGQSVRPATVVLPSGFPEPFLSNLRADATANIIQLIADTVPSLTQTGATWKGLCPFHEEQTASFHVNPEEGFFHCFGCGAGGDAFTFVQNRDQVSFREAVHVLAGRLAMEVPPSE